MKQAGIYLNDVFCGILTEDEEGFHFSYDEDYLNCENAVPLSPTVPLTNQQYDKEMMFPVFDGLIPEGWLLDIASLSWKINPRDRMSLLMACCKDCIGNISVKSFEVGGKKQGFDRETFMTAFAKSGIPVAVASKMIERMKSNIPKWNELINQSFLPEKMKADYRQLLIKRLELL